MKNFIPALIAFSILVAGCNGGSSNNNNGGSGSSGAADYFPLQIGNWWSYEGLELDSLDNPIPGTEYTLSSTVVGDTITPTHTYRILQDSSSQGGNWSVDERRYFRIEGDTIKSLMPIFDELGASYEVNMAIIPAEVGDSWTVLALDTVMTDSSVGLMNMTLLWTGEVLVIGAVSEPAGDWDNAIHIGYELNFEISVADTSLSFNMGRKVWIAPNIGMVRYAEEATYGPDGYEVGRKEDLANFVLESAP